ncbi:hypothetical protein CSUB01_08789 [Colletotrichum sublineola]|uniref:Uncharacterized protein n=1 Tax=Colletotrichum sublineola TaxID=1173701 RepID=A0A066XQY9_COLSU|nr:hypothetical protein CSUB01_08789 [Colletotrichum sublineola]
MSNSENGIQTEPDVPREHAAVSDVPPSPQALAEAAELQVLGRDGKPHLFKSLYGGLDSTSRVVIVFIRHFYCGACQAYTESNELPVSDLHGPHREALRYAGDGENDGGRQQNRLLSEEVALPRNQRDV